MYASSETVRNCFLRALSARDFALLAEHLVQVDLPKSMTLVQEHKAIQHVYFPEAGLASTVSLTPDREMIETTAFGYEGLSTFVINPGYDQVPLRTFMQIAGHGWRIDATRFAHAMHTSSTFMSLVMRFEHYKLIQCAYTALAIASYSIPERLARWVLMCQDRVGDEIRITHDYLAMMLAVRRAGVTEGIQLLEGKGFIKNNRGWITVKDRDALRAFAHGSYGVPEAEYERLIGPMPGCLTAPRPTSLDESMFTSLEQ